MTADDAYAPRDRLEALEAFLEELARRNADAPLLVEGPKDVAALRRLGLHGRVLVVNTGQSLVALVEQLAAHEVREVVLLLDWDRTGGRLHRRLRELLDAHAIRGSERERQELSRIVGNEIHSVESLPRLRESLQRRVAGR